MNLRMKQNLFLVFLNILRHVSELKRIAQGRDNGGGISNSVDIYFKYTNSFSDQASLISSAGILVPGLSKKFLELFPISFFF